ncbi:hypothetical protein [Chryseosolibacter indicus]|uniref:DDE transposase family protein n=1 Tax=Chryseosolibacter indicus TaxID=2782351 RepID=A0ABS5VQ87_9BACT|nr:hypothetical protein [Chryseosolibacter indicus]MBT1702949.1 hypothetical protein [Chryseosolibacter indicus]
MANDKLSIEDKRYLAEILFTREQLDQKVVAKRVGVSEKTMSKWVNDYQWKKMRNRLLMSKENLMGTYYEHLENLNKKIEEAKQGHGDSKQADIIIKYTAAIRNLETDLAIQDLVESGIRFIKHLQKVGTMDQVLEISDLWNSFIQASIKR